MIKILLLQHDKLKRDVTFTVTPNQCSLVQQFKNNLPLAEFWFLFEKQAIKNNVPLYAEVLKYINLDLNVLIFNNISNFQQIELKSLIQSNITLELFLIPENSLPKGKFPILSEDDLKLFLHHVETDPTKNYLTGIRNRLIIISSCYVILNSGSKNIGEYLMLMLRSYFLIETVCMQTKVILMIQRFLFMCLMKTKLAPEAVLSPKSIYKILYDKGLFVKILKIETDFLTSLNNIRYGPILKDIEKKRDRFITGYTEYVSYKYFSTCISAPTSDEVRKYIQDNIAAETISLKKFGGSLDNFILHFHRDTRSKGSRASK